MTSRSTLYLAACLTALLLLLGASDAGAQAICGRLTDEKTGSPLVGATARVENSGFVATTDGNGDYCLDYAPGEFTVILSAPGYFPQARSLNITQKSAYPMEPIQLHPVPRLVDIFGEPVPEARLSIRPVFDDARTTSEVTSAEGLYSPEYVKGEFELLFGKPGFHTDGFACNLGSREYPGEDTFVLCPEKPGVYVNQTYIGPCTIEHKRTKAERYKGDLIVPRVPALWEGEYYINGSPVPVAGGGQVAFYIYPPTSGRLGPGDDPFQLGYQVYLLRVQNGRRLASFNQRGGSYSKIDCVMEPVVQRTSQYQGGLHSRQFNVYRVVASLPPGEYAFCQFEKAIMDDTFAPGEEAYFFAIRPGPGGGGDAELFSPPPEGGRMFVGPVMTEQGVFFSFQDATARTVHLAGAFNGWSTTAAPMSSLGGGIWTTVLPIPSGSYEYKFAINGGERWEPDIWNPQSVPDPYGGVNSLVVVP